MSRSPPFSSTSCYLLIPQIHAFTTQKALKCYLSKSKRAPVLISNMVSRLVVEEEYYESSPLYYNHGIIVVMPSEIWIQNIPRDLGGRCLSESELEFG